MLTDAEKGKLFEAILEYGDSGSIPDLEGSLAVIWPLIRRRLDTDNIQYDKIVVKRKYAAYTRWAKQHGEEAESYESWLYNNGYDLEIHSPALS